MYIYIIISVKNNNKVDLNGGLMKNAIYKNVLFLPASSKFLKLQVYDGAFKKSVNSS